MGTKIVIIGAGVMGSAYAHAITNSNLRFRVELAGIYDPNHAATSKLAASSGAHEFDDVDTMLSSVEPDAAYIAAPDHLHAEPFLACMAHKVPCLVEKPLATDVTTAARMREAACQAGVHVECNFANRSNPVFVQAKAAVTRGDLGEIIGVNARLSNTIDYPTKNLTWAGKSSPGWFLLSHIFDLTRWFTNATALEVTAAGSKHILQSRGVDTYDLIHALVRYEQNVSGIYESSWTLPPSMPSPVDFGYTLLGTEGALCVDTSDQMVHLAGKAIYTFPGTLDWTEKRFSEFLDRIDTPPGSGDDPLGGALENTHLLVALHEALLSGMPVPVRTVPPLDHAKDPS